MIFAASTDIQLPSLHDVVFYSGSISNNALLLILGVIVALIIFFIWKARKSN